MRLSDLGTSNWWTKVAVWQKGQIISGSDPSIWRTDCYGHVINFDAHGDRNSPYGWEIDHILPKSLGGNDDLTNYRPLSCKNNARLGGLLGALLQY